MRRRRRRRDHGQRAAAARRPARRSGQGAAADRRRAGRRAASEGRRLRPAPLRHPASRRRSGPVRGREDRPGPGRARRPARCPSPSWTSATRSRRGASRACCRSPSRPTTGGRGSCTSTTPTPPATRGWSSTAAPRRIRWSPTRRALARSWAWTSRTPNHNGGLLLFGPGEAPKRARRRPAVHRARRRRLRGRPGPKRPGPLDPARQDPADRPAPLGRPPLLGPGLQPVRRDVRARGRRSTPTASAIRGASPSTASTGALAIGDVGQNEFEEVDLVARGEGCGRELRLVGIRGVRRASTRTSRRPDARAAGPRLPATTPAARSPAATWSATRACPRSTAATCTATSAPASCAASPPRPDAAPPTTARSGLEVPSLSSFGEDNAGHLYATSLEGPVYRLAAARPEAPDQAPSEACRWDSSDTRMDAGREGHERAETRRGHPARVRRGQLRAPGLPGAAGAPAAAARAGAGSAPSTRPCTSTPHRDSPVCCSWSRSREGSPCCGTARSSARPFLDIRERVDDDGERGLLSVAFPSNYRKSRRFYVYYTQRRRRQRGGRVQALPQAPDPRGRLVAPPGAGHSPPGRHQPQRGPAPVRARRPLYIATGDGGAADDNAAADLDMLLGKLLRIDPRKRDGRRYTVPAANPYVGRPGRNEIYAYGLRNPWRFSFDSANGRHRDRRRGGRIPRGGQLRDPGHAPRGELRLAEWEGDAASLRRAPVTTRPMSPIFTYPHSRRLRGHRRLRGPRSRPAGPRRPLPLRGPLPRRHPQLRPQPRRARATTGAPGSTSARPPRSARDSRGRIYVASLRRGRLSGSRRAAEPSRANRPAERYAPPVRGRIIWAGASLAALALVALAAGAGGGRGGSRDERRRRPRAAGRRRARRDRQAQDRQLRGADLRHPRPGRPSPSLRGRGRRHGPGASQRQPSGAGRSSTSAVESRRGASAACSRSPSTPTTAATASSTPTTRTAPGTSRSTSSAPAPTATPGRARAAG